MFYLDAPIAAKMVCIAAIELKADLAWVCTGMNDVVIFKAFFILLLIPNVASMAFLGRPAALIFVEFIPKLFF